MVDYILQAGPILIPLITIVCTGVLFLRYLRTKDGKFQLFEIGVFYSGVLLVYSIYPSLDYLTNGLSYSILADNRLSASQPSPSDLAPIYWYYALYFVSFVLAYAVCRGTSPLAGHLTIRIKPKFLWILICGYVIIWLFFACLRAFGRIQAATSYSETYLAFKTLPLVLQQVANHAQGMGLTIQLALITYLTVNYTKYRNIIWIWLATEFMSTVVLGIGSRTDLMVILLALVITYHFTVRTISQRMIGLICLGGLLLFLSLGILRLGILRGWVGYESGDVVSLVATPNEFTSIFGNAYDLRELKATGQTDEIFPFFYFADFANLVPQQILPFPKIDIADWYVQTFYPSVAEMGIGFAFGAVSESIVGMGWFDVIWRGALVGWAFACIHRWFARSQKSFWRLVFYLWVTLLSYQMFRGTTFTLVPQFIYNFAPVAWGTEFMARYFVGTRGSRGLHHSPAQAS
jgi:hypothetical protein